MAQNELSLKKLQITVFQTRSIPVKAIALLIALTVAVPMMLLGSLNTAMALISKSDKT